MAVVVPNTLCVVAVLLPNTEEDCVAAVLLSVVAGEEPNTLWAVVAVLANIDPD